MTLAGTVEAQEPILEPMTLNFDLKRRAHLKSSKRAGKSTVPLYQLSGSVESIVMNLGQRDLATILMTYQENIAEGIFAGTTSSFLNEKQTKCDVDLEMHPKSAPLSPVEICESNVHYFHQPLDDTPIRKLQNFLCQNQENESEIEFNFVIEALELTLYMDIDEVS